MNKRLSTSRIVNECSFPNEPRKNKKRSNRKSISTSESWYNNDRDSHDPSEDEVPRMEYTSMFWQQQQRLPQVQPHPVHSGQRLFAAMSDPSVCGYSAVPVTYAMEPVSLPPMYRLYQPVARTNYRPYRGRTRSSLTRIQNGPPCSNDALVNGYSSLQENGWNRSIPTAYQNGDYASLPPTANIGNKDNGEELSSEHRRYSDPGLGPANLPANSKSEDTDSVDSSSSIITIEKNNKLFMTLIEQMTKMKETNSQLFKELHQAKSDLESVKTELNQFKQSVPLEYQPGMLSDMIKEIRDASRTKEEAMLSKMKLLMESQHSQRCTDAEQLKNELDELRREKRESEERIGKLEQEVAALRLSLNSESRELAAAFEEENLALRRELQEARASSRRSSAGGGFGGGGGGGGGGSGSGTSDGGSGSSGSSNPTKLEKLREIQREKAQAASGSGFEAKKELVELDKASDSAANKNNNGSGGISITVPYSDDDDGNNNDDDDDDDEDDEDDEDEDDDDEIFTSNNSSKNKSVNNSSNSLATGPVTDL